MCALLASASGAAAEDSFDRGMAAYDAASYEEALFHFDQAVSETPASAGAHYFRGLTLQRLERYPESVAALETARGLDPSLPALDLNLGIALYRMGDCAAAGPALERATSEDPADVYPQYFLGLCAQEDGRDAEAVTHLERATSDPELEQLAWFHVGHSYSRLGRMDAAEEAYLRAARIDPNGELAATARRRAAALADGRLTDKPWWVRASAGLEYSDNLTVTQLDVTTDESDVAGVFDFGAGYRVIDQGPTELEISYDLYQSLYSDITDLNLQAHSFSAFGTTDVEGFDPTLGYRFTRSLLGGDGFLALHDVTAGVGRALFAPWYVDASYNFESRNFDEAPDRDGFRNSLVLSQFFFWGQEFPTTGTLRWRLEGQDAEGSEFDYLGNYIRVGVRGPVPFAGPLERLRYGVSYEYFSKDYDNVTPSIGKKRDDSNNTFRLQLRHPIVRYLEGVFDYQYINQDSNLPSADFAENILTWRIEANF